MRRCRPAGGCSIISRSTIRGAVQDGRIVSQLEYDEMREFSASVTQRLGALPPHRERAALVADARRIEAAVAQRAPPAEVERLARALASRLLAAYPVPLAPAAAPDLARGAALYAQQCAACHGATGRADTPMARGMEPPPIAFTDRARARERSPFALYQVIEQGLEGTAMQSYAALPAVDRWALAFHVGRYAYPEALAEQGRRYWEADPALRARIPDLEALAAITPAALARDVGEEKAAAVIAYLRGDPALLARGAGAGSLPVARDAARRGPRRLPRAATAIAPASWRWPPISTASSRSRRCSARATAAWSPRSRPRWAACAPRSGAGRAPARWRSGWRGCRPCSTAPRQRWRRRRAAAPRPSSARSPSCSARGWRRC